MNRRNLLTAGSAALGGSVLGACATANNGAIAQTPPTSASSAVQPLQVYPQREQFRVGYTSNTRGGWEGDPWKGITEGREIGFRYFEIFGTSFGPRSANARPRADAPEHITYYPDDWEGLMHRMWAIGAQFIAITGGEPGKSTDFHDPAARAEVIESHFNMTRFSRRFGCSHQKTNLGRRRPEGTTDADLREMAITCNELGRRITEELGMRFGIHPHLNSQLENERETVFMMENTDPRHVHLIIDTGHITMAGMDPVALARRYGHRVIEFHLKDVAPENRGGANAIPARDRDQMTDPFFFPLGAGGVDFPALKTHLESIDWRGALNVELDTSPWREPKESARISANYLQNTLGIPL